MLALAERLRCRDAGLGILELGEGVAGTHTDGSMVVNVMAALAQMKLEIKRGRITDSMAKH
jgi:DNA invertase Pin-like site-specific DNA recombinase